MKRNIFVAADDGEFAFQIAFTGTPDELRKAAVRLREMSASVRDVDPDLEATLPWSSVMHMGFHVDNCTWPPDGPEGGFSEADGSYGDEDVHDMGEIDEAAFVFRNKDVIIRARCMDDDGNRYSLTANVPFGRFERMLNDLADFAENDEKEIQAMK